jgi:hypothetical protein
MSDFDQNFTNAWGRQADDTSHTIVPEDDSSQSREDANHQDDNSNHQGDEVIAASNTTMDSYDEQGQGATQKEHQTNLGFEYLHNVSRFFSSGRFERNKVGQSETDAKIMVNGAISESRGPVHIFVENEQLEIPILYDGMDDSHLFQQLGVFYRFLKVKRGLAELIIPRSLVRIDSVTVILQTFHTKSSH